MNDDIYSFDKDFEPGDFEDVTRRFRDNEAREKHPAGKSATKTVPSNRVTEEEKAHAGLAVLKFLFVTIPLALLFAGLAVVPFTGAVFGTDLGFWTAFFVLGTLRWLIPRPRKSVFMEKISEKRGQ